MKHDYANLLQQVCDIAREAGNIVLRIRNSNDLHIELKDDKTPLTKADKEANKLIVSRLNKISSYPVISEENTVRTSADMFWLVDPVDGTKEFIHGGDDFTVNIALISDNRPVLGVVYAPALDTMYYGRSLGGAAYKQLNNETVAIVANANTVKPVVAVSKYHNNAKTQDFLSKLPEHEEKQIGSSLKLCLIAEGKVMMYPKIGRTSLWDTAAADAILRAAGGCIVDLDGEKLTYEISDSMLNPYFIAIAKNNSLSWKNIRVK